MAASGLRARDDLRRVLRLATRRHDRRPGDGPFDLPGEIRELVHEEVRPPCRLDDAEPTPAELAREGADLVELGESTGNGTTVGAHMRRGMGRREADGAGIHRLTDETSHRLDLVGRRRPRAGVVAHHVLTDGRVSRRRPRG